MSSVSRKVQCGERHPLPRLDDAVGRWFPRCVRMVTEHTTHMGEHQALLPDGEILRWFDVVGHQAAQAARDAQVGGDHYRKHKIQMWDIWEEYGLTAFEGAVVKYLLRRKGDRLEDLKKARHTLDRMIEAEEARRG